MTKHHIGSVTLSISGEYITNHYREMALQGDYLDAIEGLKDALIGMTSEQAINVLTGNYKIIGDSSDDSVAMVPDNEFQQLKDIYYQYYDKYVFKDGDVYELKSLSFDIGSANVWGASNEFNAWKSTTFKDGEVIRDMDANGLAIYFGSLTGDENFHTIEELNGCGVLCNWEIVDLRLDNIPNHLTKNIHTSKAFLNSYQNGDIEVMQFDESRAKTENVLNEFERRKRFKAKMLKQSEEVELSIDQIYNKIWEQNGSETVILEGYKIPAKPFHAWCLNRSYKLYHFIKWCNVSKSGYKMPEDDPTHTDWVIGAGIEPSEFYANFQHLNTSAYDYRFDYISKLTKSNLVPLVSFRNTSLQTSVQHVEADEIIKGDDSVIVIIPDCTTKWANIAKQVGRLGGIIIAQTGGELSHLVINKEEYGCDIYLHKNAMELFEHRTLLKIEPELNQYTFI